MGYRLDVVSSCTVVQTLPGSWALTVELDANTLHTAGVDLANALSWPDLEVTLEDAQGLKPPGNSAQTLSRISETSSYVGVYHIDPTGLVDGQVVAWRVAVMTHVGIIPPDFVLAHATAIQHTASEPVPPL